MMKEANFLLPAFLYARRGFTQAELRCIRNSLSTTVGIGVKGMKFFTDVDYSTATAQDYIVDMNAKRDPMVLFAYKAPLSGFAGGADVVFPPGFVADTSQNGVLTQPIIERAPSSATIQTGDLTMGTYQVIQHSHRGMQIKSFVVQ